MAVYERLGRTILVAALLVVARSLGSVPELEEAARPVSLPEPVAQRLHAENEAQRQRAIRMLSGYAPILEFLPIESLEKLEVRAETLEFCFDFDGRHAYLSATVDGYIGAGYRGMDPDCLMFGTAEQVAEEMTTYGNLGFTDISIRNIAGWSTRWRQRSVGSGAT